MSEQALVIGLGQFGMAVARSLVERGAEVLAVDRRRNLVDLAADFVTEAVALDATDEDALHQLQPAKRDFTICAIGDDSREASIICTALLRQMGTPRIIARANNPLHQRILHLVGAHQVVNPEEEFGKRLANRLLFKHVVNEMPLGNNLHMTELRVPAGFAGKSLVELQLPKKYGVTVVAVQRGGTKDVVQPDAEASLQTSDILIVVSNEHAIQSLLNDIA